MMKNLIFLRFLRIVHLMEHFNILALFLIFAPFGAYKLPFI